MCAAQQSLLGHLGAGLHSTVESGPGWVPALPLTALAPELKV